MGRDLGPKCRQCRRAGTKLFLKGERCFSAKCALVKRNYPPGLHGQKGFGRKITEYGKQLQAKQIAKKMYRIREKQFSSYFIKASRMQGDPGVNLMNLLEMRFDAVVYKLGLAESREQARQLVRHGHFRVNGNKVDIPSYGLKQNDKISIKEKSRKNKLISELIKNAGKDLPDWMVFDPKTSEAQVVGKPDPKDFDPSIDLRLIIEYYSR